MLKKIKLYGQLATKYGQEFAVDVLSPAEAVRALLLQLPGFEQDVRAGEFICIRGDFDEGEACDEELIHLRFGSVAEFHLIPAAVGHAKGSIGKILMGVVLIAAVMIPGMQVLGFGAFSALTSGTYTAATLGAMWTAVGTLGHLLIGVGALMIIGGVSQMLAPTPSTSSSSASQSYIFNGAVNTSQDGTSCPLVFGRLIVGSVVASAGITSERISASDIPTVPEGDMVLASVP
jgi:predicted phage tail protein